MSRIDSLMTSPGPWVADAGLETAMIFHEGFDLPHFASFPLLDSEAGRAAMTRWFDGFADLARKHGTGLVLDTVTWRANMGWAAAMGMTEAGIRAANRQAADFAMGLRAMHETPGLPVVVNGLVGPAGDGYRIDTMLTAAAAEVVHLPQIDALAKAGVDMVTVMTMTYPAEAIGVARAALRSGVPHVLSFTVETDGKLVTGQPLQDALAEVEAETGGSALFYMVNCAHPTHFAAVLAGPMHARIGGIRANASRQSHAQLDEATTLDDGDPDEFGALYAGLRPQLPNLRIIGGCCGSDHRHVAAACNHLHPSGT